MPWFRLTLSLILLLPSLATATQAVLERYRVEHVYPHARDAFTEGLFYQDGYLYESTGQQGASEIRKVELDTGRVLQRQPLASNLFGEGIAACQSRLIQLTWHAGQGFIYDLADFRPRDQFRYSGEGWGLTCHDQQLIMSDGSARLRLLDPQTLKETGHIDVTLNGKPLSQLNELEWVKGEIYANVWLSSQIARIDPATGRVVGMIDLSGLLPAWVKLANPYNDVLNGIAYDAQDDRLFVTGKHWPYLYQIKRVKTD